METYRLTGQLGEVYGWLAAQWERTGGARARDWASWRSWGWQSSQRRHKTTYARVCENRKWVNEKPKTSHITYIYKRVLKTNFTVCSSGNGFYCWASRNMMDDTIESTFRAICINVIMYLFARHFPWDNYGFRSFSKHEHVFFLLLRMNQHTQFVSLWRIRNTIEYHIRYVAVCFSAFSCQ